MTMPLRFWQVSTSDHRSPSNATPSVSIWSPGNPTWSQAIGSLSNPGLGWWSVAPNPVDQSGGDPLLLYATALSADPTPGVYYPDGSKWIAGSTTLPIPIWLGTTASGGYEPLVGASVSVSLSIDGAAFAQGVGTIYEPGGSGNGNGFYLYYPATSEMKAGDIAIVASASGAYDYGADITVLSASSTGGSSAPTGNGPQQTYPLYASDEKIAILARRDFVVLCPDWQSMATGTDGVFVSGSPWVLTSQSINFEAQGVTAQNVVVFNGVAGNARAFPGSKGWLYAVDSVAGNSVTLRVVGMGSGQGQPPAPADGMTGVSFSMPTLQPQIDVATYALKREFCVDENMYFRSSDWIYQGAEEALRTFRDACCWATLRDAYRIETRDTSNAGDFARKAKLAETALDECKRRLQVLWGPMGASASPTDKFSGKLSR